MFETEEQKERIILVAVATADGDDTEQSLDELEELGQTAGAVTVAKVIQNREKVHAGTYVGKGKIEEIKNLAISLDADTVVCDDELSPAQYHNLQDALEIKVIDRTVMILDIFAKRASTSEGKLQVELAQLRYRASHLVGGRSELSRLGGGIGTRGPGEQKLEMDRRLIKERITLVKRELEQVKRTRELTRKKRQENPTPVVAIVGYTNAGKSTLLNYLTGAGVLSEDQLFATLDTSVRRLVTPEHRDFLLIDTVGFIKKLPHDLIEAFKSTLEETVYADLLLHVVDASNPDFETCIDTVEKILQEIGAGNRPRYLILNKIDKASEEITPSPRVAGGYGKAFNVSALRGDGLELLKKEIVNYFVKVDKKYECILPYEKAGVLSYLHEKGTVEREEYREDGIYVKGKMPPEHFERVSGYEMRERKEL